MNQPSKQFWDVLLKRAASDCANAIELYIQTERERESLIEPTPGRSKGKTRNRGGQPRARKRKPLLVKNRISADTYLPTPLVGSAWNGIYGIAGFSPSPDSPPSTSIFSFFAVAWTDRERMHVRLPILDGWSAGTSPRVATESST